MNETQESAIISLGILAGEIADLRDAERKQLTKFNELKEVVYILFGKLGPCNYYHDSGDAIFGAFKQKKCRTHNESCKLEYGNECYVTYLNKKFLEIIK